MLIFQARSMTSYAALVRLAERHASTREARDRQVNDHLIGPAEAVRLVAMLGGGSAAHLLDEPPVDADDLVDALSLVPLVRAETDELELSLLLVARGRGMTWAQIGRALGLGSAQAAQQRHDRLVAREQVHQGM